MWSLDKPRTCVRGVLGIINYTDCLLDCFLPSTFTNITFHFSEFCSNLTKICVHKLKNSVHVRFLKTTNCFFSCFRFSFFGLESYYTVVIESNLQWIRLSAYSGSLRILTVEKALDCKALRKCFDCFYSLDF